MEHFQPFFYRLAPVLLVQYLEDERWCRAGAGEAASAPRSPPGTGRASQLMGAGGKRYRMREASKIKKQREGPSGKEPR